MATLIDTTFEDVTIDELAAMPDSERDELPFGVIGIDRDGVAQVYNETEARMAGLRRESVVGVPFFEAVAQCMNNFMVAQRFEDEAELDDTIPFVLTLRMRPTPVRLRLLGSKAQPLHFVLIQR